MNRLQQLLQFLEEEPNDPFNIYAVAVEYLKLDTSKAMELFHELVKNYENYLPTYYHLGKLYEEQGDKASCMAIFMKGIQKAKEQQDRKALTELQSAYNEIMLDA